VSDPIVARADVGTIRFAPPLPGEMNQRNGREAASMLYQAH
jgi:hypothetical protein